MIGFAINTQFLDITATVFQYCVCQSYKGACILGPKTLDTTEINFFQVLLILEKLANFLKFRLL